MTNLLLDWVIDGVALTLVAEIAAHLVPRRSAAQRHLFWWVALGGVVGLPLMSVAASPGDTAAGWSGSTAVAAPQAGPWTIPAPAAWILPVLTTLWAFFVAVALMRLALNAIRLRRVAARAVSFDRERETRLRLFEAIRCTSRPVSVLVSDDIATACAVGFFHPRILLSSTLVTSLDHEATEAVLLHEYAHLARYDDWSCLLQRLVVACAGVHPAVTWLSRRIDQEREAACDDAVVAWTGAAVPYARSLTTAAELCAARGGLVPVVAPGASIRGAGLHARVARLLAIDAHRGRYARARTAGAAALIATGVASAAAVPPPVVVVGLERPMQLLSTLPLPPRPRAIVHLPAMTSSTLREQQGVAAQRESLTPPAVQAMTPSSGATIETAEPAESTPAASSPTSEPETLTSLSLAPRFVTIGSTSPSEPAGPAADQPRIGARAAKAGTVAGRAGQSLGRFFKRGGQGIASRF